ncbi:hypothetical protein WMF04_04855 [Sorangium sp. So ce260]|uniref:hypothetical protein n=1 Tax=Sorangium sp. So ce260 TaxID=3133291 RepID=UPI003F5F2E2C
MTRDRELLELLREVDERLAAVPPSPRLEARLGERLRGARAAPAARAGRPLALAFAAGAAAFVAGAALHGPADGPSSPGLSARAPAVPSAGVAGGPPDADGGLGLTEPRGPESGRSAPPPRISAPLLQDPRLRVAPAPPSSPPAPPRSAPLPVERDAPLREPRRDALPLERAPSAAPGAPPRSPGLAPSSSGRGADDPESPSHAAPRAPPPIADRAPGGLGVSTQAVERRGGSPESAAAEPGRPGEPQEPQEPQEPPAEPPVVRPETSCRTADDLQSEAHARCEAEGLLVGDFVLNEPCEDGGFRSAGYTCTEPLPVSECWGGELGDGFTCHDGTALKDRAYTACQQSGAALTIFQPAGSDPSCEDYEMTKATYECCPAEEPPPPLLCWSGSVAGTREGSGEGAACHEPASLEEQAAAACEANGDMLQDFRRGLAHPSCEGDRILRAAFTCCPR